MNYEDLKPRLRTSPFRSRFRPAEKDCAMIAEKGWHVIEAQARNVIRSRLADAFPKNDGRQTPMRGSPVFIAQHATGTCCRSCLEKWHGIPKGAPLTEEQIEDIVHLLVDFLKDQAGNLSRFPQTPDLFKAFR